MLSICYSSSSNFPVPRKPSRLSLFLASIFHHSTHTKYRNNSNPLNTTEIWSVFKMMVVCCQLSWGISSHLNKNLLCPLIHWSKLNFYVECYRWGNGFIVYQTSPWHISGEYYWGQRLQDWDYIEVVTQINKEMNIMISICIFMSIFPEYLITSTINFGLII